MKLEVTSYTTLKGKGILTPSTGACTSLPNLMIVMKFWTLITNLVQKMKGQLKTNKFFCLSVYLHLTGMGKPIVRKYVHNSDAQAVWKDFQEHMKAVQKGPQKRRVAQYVTNTVFDDNFKGTTEQFVLHFNE